MPEPSLSELVSIQGDANLGTTGMTDFVPDTRYLNEMKFEAAKFKAQMDFQKYTQFLNNFKDITKEGKDLASMDLAPEDRTKLQRDMANIFSEIAKDPKSALGGTKMYDIQSKLQKLTSDATQSKQDNAFDKYHRAFLDRTPDMKTDENKAKVEGYLKNQPLGARQPYILDPAAPEFDGEKLFEGILKQSTRPFSENYLNPKDDEGKTLMGYLKTETGDEVNPKAVQSLWDLALQHPDAAKSIQKRYDKLPPKIKEQYEANGGLPTFFSEYGKQMLDAHFPEGSYTPTKQGNYRFNRKSDFKADPNYMKAAELAERKRQHNDEMDYKWSALEKGDKEDKDTADSVINEATSIINKGQETVVEIEGEPEKVLRIGDPFLLQKFGNIDKDGNATNVPDVIEYNKDKNQVRLVYYDGETKSGKRIIDESKTKTLDQRGWLKEIAKRTSPNKDLGGVNKIVDNVLSKNGDSLYGIATKKTVAADKKQNSNPETEYSNITETNKGKIGIKNGKWYDIKTGKEIK